MPLFNNALTKIPEIDSNINKYFAFIRTSNVLPDGTYVLAGGCMRALFDKSRVRDLDIYILGDKSEHDRIIEEFVNTLTVQKFANPFAAFRVVNIDPDTSNHIARTLPDDIDDNPISDWPEIEGSTFKAPIQLISFSYDKEYFNRIPTEVKLDERFSDTYVTSMKEVVNSFDLTLSKAAVEFTINGNSISIDSVSIPHDCIIDICMRKLRLAEGDRIVPQQLCTIKRFHKLIKLGYDTDDNFYLEWKKRLKANPHVLECEYDD